MGAAASLPDLLGAHEGHNLTVRRDTNGYKVLKCRTCGADVWREDD